MTWGFNIEEVLRADLSREMRRAMLAMLDGAEYSFIELGEAMGQDPKVASRALNRLHALQFVHVGSMRRVSHLGEPRRYFKLGRGVDAVQTQDGERAQPVRHRRTKEQREEAARRMSEAVKTSRTAKTHQQVEDAKKRLAGLSMAGAGWLGALAGIGG